MSAPKVMVASEWTMQKVMATLGLAAKEIGQSFDEQNAVYYSYCPWAEFEKLSAIGHGPLATEAIRKRRISQDKPEAPKQLREHCQQVADDAVALYQKQEADAAVKRKVRAARQSSEPLRGQAGD